MNKQFNFLVVIVVATLLFSCGDPKKQKLNGMNTYIVTQQTFHKTLYFTGTVQPIKESTLTSPMEAVVESMNFHYGQVVKKGDVALVLNSTELQRQYNELLTDYLKAKDSFSMAKVRFLGSEELWQAGLISKNNYLSEKSNVDNSRVTFMQATRKLSELMEKMEDASSQNVSQLSLADFAKVKKIMAANHHLIQLKAPSDGVLLYPPKSGEDKSTRISIGSVIKPGQVIALVGDLTGVSVEIDVPEVDIDKIHQGMGATITGVAFGKHQLKGQVVTVNAQATNTSHGGLPSFTAVVEVNSLTPEQQPWIKVGMSAAIQINIDSQHQLVVPIAAVKREKGNSVVHLQLPNGAIVARVITTGPAQADKVVVASGLKEGDVVVYG